VFAGYDFADKFTGSLGPGRIVSTNGADGSHSTLSDGSLFGIVVGAAVAALGEPVSRDPVQQGGQRRALAARFFFQSGLSVDRKTPAVDFRLHALQCSANAAAGANHGQANIFLATRSASAGPSSGSQARERSITALSSRIGNSAVEPCRCSFSNAACNGSMRVFNFLLPLNPS